MITKNEYIPHIDGKPRVDIHSDKYKQTFTVDKTEDGFIFYEVRVSKGSVPAQLQGKFSRMSDAVKAVEHYIKYAPVSKAVERDRKTEVRERAK